MSTTNTFFGDLSYVGTLLFAEYPTTVVFKDLDGCAWIEEWIDVDEEGLDEYILYKPSLYDFNAFLNSNLDHLSFISNSEHRFRYKGETKNPIGLQLANSLPYETLPAPGVFFDKNDAVELDKVLSGFDFESLSSYADDQLLEVAKLRNCPIINIHINNGSNVKHGSIKTPTLLKVLKGYEALRREIVLDARLGKSRGKNKSVPRKVEIEATTEIVAFKAASFNVFLKPLDFTTSLFTNEDSETALTNKIFDVISLAHYPEKLKDFVSNSSAFSFKALENLNNSIVTNELDVDFNYLPLSTSPSTTLIQSKKLTVAQSATLLEEMSKGVESLTEMIQIKGFFRSINLDSKTAIINDLEDNTYSCKFDKSLEDLFKQLNFNTIYHFQITQTVKRSRTVDSITNQILDVKPSH